MFLKGYKYFKLINNEENTKIMISLTPLTGESFIVLSYGEFSRPTINSYDWESKLYGQVYTIIDSDSMKRIKGKSF